MTVYKNSSVLKAFLDSPLAYKKSHETVEPTLKDSAMRALFQTARPSSEDASENIYDTVCHEVASRQSKTEKKLNKLMDKTLSSAEEIGRGLTSGANERLNLTARTTKSLYAAAETMKNNLYRSQAGSAAHAAQSGEQSIALGEINTLTQTTIKLQSQIRPAILMS